MSIKSQAEFDRLREIGLIVRRALDAAAAAVRPGATTREIDQAGARVLAAHGAESAPPKVYNFPGAFCISVNDEAIHGIPGDRVIAPGDLVKLDLVAEKDGYFADAAVTVPVGAVCEQARSLAQCAETAFSRALRVARAGNRVHDIGHEVESEARRRGFAVIRELCGHGVGRTIYEPPAVPNYYDPAQRMRLTEGLVITIEPILAAGRGRPQLQRDGWTICTADGSLAAHYEHTVVITRGTPVLLTAA